MGGERDGFRASRVLRNVPRGSRPEASSLPFVSAVWLRIMMPVLGIRSLSPFAIAYLDRLLL